MTSDATEAPDTLQTAAEPTAALPPRQTSVLTWVLIAVNVGLLLAVLIGGVVVLGIGPFGDSDEDPGPGGGIKAPGDDDPGITLTPTDRTPDVNGNNTPIDPNETIDPAGTPTGGTRTPVDVDLGGETPLPVPDGDDGIADPTDRNIFGPDADAMTEAGRARSAWRSRMSEAAELERRKEYRQALRMLEKIKADAPKDEQPAGLDEAINRVKTKLDQQGLEESLYG